jgi:hypothetical protein
MNQPKDPGTQLSFLSDSQQTRPVCVNARMAVNVLDRLLSQSEKINHSAAVFFKAVFPAAVSASEQLQGLPVTKTTLRPRLLDPAASIILRPPTRPDEFSQMETLLEFVNRRLGSATDKARLEQDVSDLLGAQNPEMLITPDGMPSQLFAVDRIEASQIFKPLTDEGAAEATEALVEAYVLLRSNNADVQSGIASLFWRQNTGSAPASHYIDGCGDGQTRAYFKALLAKPEDVQQRLFSSINLETFYSTLGGMGEVNG